MADFSDASFRAIFEAHYTKLFRLCLARTGGNESDAHKITMLVFETLWENRAHIPDREDWGGWLYKTTVYKLSEYYRAKKKALPYLDVLHAEQADPADSTACSDDILCSKALVLSVLSEEEHALYDAVFTNKEKYKVIADRLCTSEGAVKMRVRRLRAKLEARIRALHLQ